MTVRELLLLARQVEMRVGRLYEHMARDFEGDTEMVRFLHTLSQQEQGHADLVQKMNEDCTLPNEELIFNAKMLVSFIDSIDDIEDEVCQQGITIDAALEIVHHLENSVAERFYERIPESAPGLPNEFKSRMIRTARAHLQEVEAFIEHCRKRSGVDGI